MTNIDAILEIPSDSLAGVQGGAMPASAQWIMQHESGGNTHAKNPHSSAFGAFQMTIANRRHYMHGNYGSTNLSDQYAAASGYVRDRYGSWDNAKRFWQSHHWY